MNGSLHGVNGQKIWRTESKQSSDEQDKKIPQSALEVHHQQLQGNYGFARARKACSNKAKPIFARPRQTCLRWRFVYLRLALPVAVVPPLLRLAPVGQAQVRSSECRSPCNMPDSPGCGKSGRRSQFLGSSRSASCTLPAFQSGSRLRESCPMTVVPERPTHSPC